MPARDILKRYGSVRVLRDGRVRLSALTDPMLVYVSFLASSHTLDMYRVGRVVLFMSLNRGRIVSACFTFDISPDELRGVVSDMRRMGHGLEHWIIPGLEYTSLISTFQKDNPAAYAIVPELLESCRDLPVVEHWKRVRAVVIANAENARAQQQSGKATPGTRRERRTRSGRPRAPRVRRELP